MSHSIKIDVQTLIAQHNATSTDGSQLVLLCPQAVEFLEKVSHDNGQHDLAQAAGQVIAQAAMYHGQYEANMIERFVSEGRVELPEDAAEADQPHMFGGDIEAAAREVMQGILGAQPGMIRTPMMGMGVIGIKAASLPEALEQLGAILGGQADAGEPAEVTKARETLARWEADQRK